MGVDQRFKQADIHGDGLVNKGVFHSHHAFGIKVVVIDGFVIVVHERELNREELALVGLNKGDHLLDSLLRKGFIELVVGQKRVAVDVVFFHFKQ